VILGFVTYQSTRELIADDSWVTHTLQVRQSLADLLSAVLGAETRRRDYLLTPEPKYLRQFLAGVDQIRPAVSKIASLLDEMNKTEENLLQARSGAARRSGKRAIDIAVFGGGFSTLVVIFAIAILRRDLQERRRAEEALRRREAELREAQRVAGAGSWEWDVQTDKMTWSEELYHIAGRNPAEPAPIYKEHPKTYTPESFARLEHAVEVALQTGANYELDLEMVRPDGTTRWVAARGEAVPDATGRISKLRGSPGYRRAKTGGA
jgi:CHASE3 domain sensor protein